MKTFLKYTLLASVVAVTTAAQAEVNIVSWGGAYTASQQKAYQDTYKNPGDINFINYNGGLGEVRTQVESGNVTWDIVDVLPHEGRVGCDEGLFEELDRSIFKPAPDGTPMEDDMMIPLPNDCVVPQIFWSYVPFYQEGTFKGEQPTTIADFFNVKKFPGKRGIHTWPNALIEMALAADGVAIKDIYKVMSTDEGIDRAFAMLDKIKDHAVFWSAGSKPLELVQSGEVSMALAYNGRVGAAILSEGAKFVPVWDAQVLEEEWLVLMKGAPHREEAIDFLVHASTTESQALQAKYINYGPMRASAFEIMKKGEPWFHNGKNIMPHMPNRPEVMARTIVANPDWWADYGDSISERYTAWMGQ
ncbi:MAG: extracellular solute-binding protein [Gammaproteobacteria bacterium]|jgi:putative spermidine/putrescine transport system substrate-binding protein